MISSKPTFLEIVQDISALLGRQRLLPDWVYDGIILGIQGGTETTLRKLERMQQAGVPVTAVWMQDWQGERYTSFGKRLRWNWQWDEKLYPNLDREIKRLNKEGFGFSDTSIRTSWPTIRSTTRRRSSICWASGRTVRSILSTSASLMPQSLISPMRRPGSGTRK